MKHIVLALFLAAFALSVNPAIAQSSSDMKKSAVQDKVKDKAEHLEKDAKMDMSSKKDATKDKATRKVNINKATAEQLKQIPGLGEVKAKAIVDYIAENGPMKDKSELTKVKGIGDKLADKIAPYVSY